MRKENHHKKNYICISCQKFFQSHDLFPLAFLHHDLRNFIQNHYAVAVESSYLCLKDLKYVRSSYLHHTFKESGRLSEADEEILVSFEQETLLARNINPYFEKKSTVGERVADRIGVFGGSWTFISCFMTFLILWMILNSSLFFLKPIDPYPYIFLNLILSCLAAIQAPIIMMSQNRIAAKDRLKAEHDYQVNLKAELEIRHLHQKLDHFIHQHWIQNSAPDLPSEPLPAKGNNNEISDS